MVVYVRFIQNQSMAQLTEVAFIRSKTVQFLSDCFFNHKLQCEPLMMEDDDKKGVAGVVVNWFE